MKVLFISHALTNHQKPFSDCISGLSNVDYCFLEADSSIPIRKRDIPEDQYPTYVVRESGLTANQLAEVILNADVVIVGSAPNKLVANRIRSEKLTFRYAERPLKKGFELWKYPYRFLKWHLINPPNKPVYMLCASAYTALDYAKYGLFRNRCFKWGYFPKSYHYNNIDSLIESKEHHSLVWVARYLDWKHPELAIEVGKRLKQDGYHFTLSMIGAGALLEQVASAVLREGLEKEIRILGAMPPEEVRTHMENAQIHIFTSDRNEGWGAVLNEAMNSGCVPVANRAIGSAPYLIEDGKNGFLYDSVDELYEKAKYLLDHNEERTQMAHAAYRTIVDEWNAENAAEQFIALASQILEGKKMPVIREKGICSKAEILKG